MSDSALRRFAIHASPAQAAALAAALLARPAFAQAWQWLPPDPQPPRSASDWATRHPGEVDLVLWPVQRSTPGAAVDKRGFAPALRPGGQVITFVWPEAGALSPLRVAPAHVDAPADRPWLDLITLVAAATGLADEARCRELSQLPSLLEPHELEAVHRLAEYEQARLEQGLDMALAAPLARHLRTPGLAPAGPQHAAHLLAGQVLAVLGLPDEAPPPAPAEEPPLAAQVAPALAFLAGQKPNKLRRELATQRRNPLGGLVIQAIERALAQRWGLTTAGLREVATVVAGGISADLVLNKANPQSIGFMTDILGVLRAHLLPRHAAGQHFSVLDLGAKTGAGSELLGMLGHGRTYSKLKFSVTSADIDPTYRAYSAAQNRHVEYLNADVFTTGRQWDIVICSHVIEHVPNPLAFVKQLRGLAKQYLVMAFPYGEDPAKRIPGHVNSLDHAFVRALAPARYDIYEGLFWGQSLCCVAVIETAKPPPAS